MAEKKRNIVVRTLETLGHLHTLHAIAQAEFVRTLLLPVVIAVATGAAGWIGHIPLMWIIMAVALAFMGTTQGVLSASTYLERKNPAHKLQVLKHLFNFDLVPINPPNRKHRRSAAAQGGAPAVPAHRHFQKGQLGIEVWNRSSFPLSIIVQSAETEIEELKPPRAKYPKPPMVLEPGNTLWIHDDAIDLEDMDCGNLDGSMEIIIKYGLPGKEYFEIKQKGTVEIFMESFGQYKGLYFHPAAPDTGVPGEAKP
jgi:hypothetical protein